VDVAEFNMIRPLREVEVDRVVRLSATKVLVSRADEQPPVEPLALSWETLSEEMFGNRGADPLVGVGGVDDPSLLQRVYELVLRLDRRVGRDLDGVTGKRIATTEQKVLPDLRLEDVDWHPAYSIDLDVTALYAVALLGYRAALVDELTKENPDYDRAMKLTLLALLAAVLEIDRDALMALSREEVFDRLNRWPLVLDGVTSAQMSGDPKVELVREAKKADLYVVRREWAGYVPGEIANIRNVMAGEHFRQRDFTTTEVETTTTGEVEISRTTETEEESKVESELSQEVNSQIGVTINGYADTSAEFTYAMVSASVSAGVDAGFSMQRSEKQARKIAKEAVSRAVSRVDSRTRETRVRRELMRTEQGYTYGLDNTDGENLHGVYRWVDRIDTYQTFRFPDRLLLEFQIPDPAEFYRWRTQHAADTTGEKPPDWDEEFKPERISIDKPDELMALAKTYRATNLPPPPDKEISVARTVNVEAGRDWEPSSWEKTVPNPPTATKELTIPITPGYEATEISYSGIGYPVLGAWLDTTKDWSAPGKGKWGYRSGFATVSIGKATRTTWEGGRYNDASTPALVNVDEVVLVPADGSAQEEVQYGRAVLEFPEPSSQVPSPSSQVTIAPAARDEIKVAVTSTGLSQCSVTMLAKCTLTKEAEQAWRLTVYDTLYNAWASWKRDYDSSLARDIFGSVSADAGSTQRNELTIREELKREVISWLLGPDYPFGGRPGRRTQTEQEKKDDYFPDVDFDQARTDAPVIQFLEQAFEWNNMSWIFYPYYWAARKNWPDRTQLVANDPEFERFLRSGSARVIVPARPGFDDAVKNWLEKGVPFLSGRLPTPDEDLYIRIDTEIRELTSPWEGGYAGEDWQSQVSTTMLYLEETGDLPFVNTEHRLPAPKDKWYTPKSIIAFP
jgi:hypothetical protein